MHTARETAGESIIRWGALGAFVILACLLSIGIGTAIMGV